jgi:hypothetical protein
VIITATLVFFPNGSNVVAIGFLKGLAPKPLVLISVAPTVWAAFQGMFAQAKFIQDATAPTRWPLAPIEVN